MTPYDYIDLPENGCLAACIGAILDWPATDAESLCNIFEHGSFYDQIVWINKELRGRGYQIKIIDTRRGTPLAGYWIAIGLGAEGDKGDHAVVMRGQRMVYNPNGGGSLVKRRSAAFLLPVFK